MGCPKCDVGEVCWECGKCNNCGWVFYGYLSNPDNCKTEHKVFNKQ